MRSIFAQRGRICFISFTFLSERISSVSAFILSEVSSKWSSSAQKHTFQRLQLFFFNSSLSPHAKRTSSYNPNLVHCYPKMAHMQNVPNECVKISQDGLISTTPLCSFNGNLFPNKAIDNKENKREWKREKSKSYVIKLYM